MSNEALVHADSEDESLEKICRKIVDGGGYRLAWVGFCRYDNAKSVVPAAYAGECEGESYVAGLRLCWGDDALRGLCCKAIRSLEAERRPVAYFSTNARSMT